MRKSLNFREGAEYLSAEERKRRNKLLQDRMYLMKYESELTKVTFIFTFDKNQFPIPKSHRYVRRVRYNRP